MQSAWGLTGQFGEVKFVSSRRLWIHCKSSSASRSSSNGLSSAICPTNRSILYGGIWKPEDKRKNEGFVSTKAVQGLATPTDIPSRRMIRSLERNTHEHLSEHGVELKPLLLGAGFIRLNSLFRPLMFVWNVNWSRTLFTINKAKVLPTEQMAKSEPFITGHDDRGGGGQAEAQPLFITITLCHATVQTSKLAGFQHRRK